MVRKADIHEYILDRFFKEPTPLHAVIKIGKQNLTWLASQILCNMQGRPLRLLPFQSVWLDALWHKKNICLIAGRGSGKTWSLGLYALLRALLCPGSEIIIVGSSLRQSMKVFSYIVKFYNQSPILQEALPDGPKMTNMGPYFDIGLSKILALPIGDGEKIRGQRSCVDPNTIIETKNGLMRIKDTFNLEEVPELYTGFGKIEKPSHFIKTVPIDAYRIKTMLGYEIICSDIHKLYTIDGWKNVVDLKKGDLLPIKNQYEFPDKDYIKYDDIIIDEKMGFLLGLLISEGSVSNKYEVSIVNTDKNLIDKTSEILRELNLDHNIYYRPAYIDFRGWNCKEGWEIKYCNLKWRQKLAKLGLDYKKARFKTIPWSILYSKKSVVVSFLKGLFLGDGSAFLYKDKIRNNNFGTTYYTASEQLAIDLQVLLLKFGIFCGRSSRKSHLSDHLQYMLRFYSRNTFLIYDLLKIEKWEPIYEKCYKNPKFISPYNNVPVYSIEKLKEKRILYDYTIPKSKSFIGNGLINHNTNTLADEISSIDENIFETVIKPFASVHADPEESVFIEEFCDRIYKLGANQKMVDEIFRLKGYGNQTVISGTASYEFNHCFRYYESYKAIIASKGDINSIKKAMEIRARTAGNVFNQMSKEDLKMLSKSWKNYCVITMPYDKLPKGFLDIESVTNDKFVFSSSRFSMEYEAKFCKDSDGFIKRSIINNATPNGSDKFSLELYGDPTAEYVLGLDPAQHNDNFGAVVLRLNPTNISLVYVDAWVGKDTPASAKKIREILRKFNIVRIAMDQGGGGDAIAATLKLKELCEEDEVPILSVREQIADKILLSEKGLNILEIVKFTPAWISLAAHGLEGDIQHQRLIFPSYPEMEDIYNQYSNFVLMRKRLINNEEKKLLEDLVFGKEGVDFEKLNIGTWDNIEATLDEMCAIERQVTPGGVERFDLPSNLGEQREGLDVRRKDRFSALMLAAYAARVYRNYNKRKPILIPGGSPESILSHSKNRRPIVRRGNVMY